MLIPVWIVKLVRAVRKGKSGALSFPESKQDVLHGASSRPVCFKEDYGWVCSLPLGSGGRCVFGWLVWDWCVFLGSFSLVPSVCCRSQSMSSVGGTFRLDVRFYNNKII